MKNSKFIIDKFAKLIEQGLITSKDLSSEILNIFKSKRDEFVFKMKLTSKDEFEILSKRVENLENKISKLETKKPHISMRFFITFLKLIKNDYFFFKR